MTIPTGLVGKHVSVVEAALKNKKFKVNISYEPSSEHKKDCVTFVEGEGVSAEEGSTVNIVVSTGADTSQTVPEEDGAENDQKPGNLGQ